MERVFNFISRDYLNGVESAVPFNFGRVFVVYSAPLGRNGSAEMWVGNEGADDADADASIEADRWYTVGDDGSDATDRRAVLAIAMETFSVNITDINKKLADNSSI